MRKILLVLSILCVTLIVHGQSFKRFRQGCYYDSIGNKHEGYIFKTLPAETIFKDTGDQITFVQNKDADKQIIKADELKSFIIGQDSFVVSHDPAMWNKPFLYVCIDKSTKIYISYVQGTNYMAVGGGVLGGVVGAAIGSAAGSNNAKSTYYYGITPDHVTRITRKIFKEFTSSYMGDNPLIANKIKDSYFRYGDMAELIEAYKTGVIKERQKNDTFKYQEVADY